MEAIHAKAVQLLLANPESDIPAFSEHFDIPEGVARGLRIFWNRALTGKCAVCGTRTNGARRCRNCKRRNVQLLDRRSSIALLRDMDPSRPAQRAVCSSCGGVVLWSADHVLKRCRRFGFFRPPTPPICTFCLREGRRKPVGLNHRSFDDLVR